jgi:hypothetical protein
MVCFCMNSQDITKLFGLLLILRHSSFYSGYTPLYSCKINSLRPSTVGLFGAEGIYFPFCTLQVHFSKPCWCREPLYSPHNTQPSHTRYFLYHTLLTFYVTFRLYFIVLLYFFFIYIYTQCVLF